MNEGPNNVHYLPNAEIGPKPEKVTALPEKLAEIRSVISGADIDPADLEEARKQVGHFNPRDVITLINDANDISERAPFYMALMDRLAPPEIADD
ncbi:MAG: hypothetical protein JWN64_114 [Parcubacteria group bacterium]|nr:hypothetical protein [Parcubacteria group bacterium]